MKRFFSLALALCMMLSLVTVNAFAAIAASDITVKGTINTTLPLPASEFLKGISDEGTMVELTVTDLPSASDGVLLVDSDPVVEDDPIPWASLSSLVFEPVREFHSTAVFTWTATDNVGTTSPADARLNFSVSTPTAHNQTVKVFMNTPKNGQLTATDTSGFPLRYAIKTDPAKGDVTLSSTTGAFTYTPPTNFVGTETFTFTVSNGYETSAHATVTLNVSNVLAPTASAASITVDYHKSVNGTLTGIDPNLSPLVLDYEIITHPKKGSISSIDPNTGRFTYTHTTDKLVTDTFTFRTSNGFRKSDPATVTVNINPPTPEPYRDMTNHWAGFSAGVLKTLNLAVGEKIKDMYYYNPTKPVTRKEFALFLNSVFEIPLSKNTASHFADVTDANLIESINPLFERNISSGTLVGTRLYFYPDRVLTRIEAMKMIDNAMKFSAPADIDLTFADRNMIPNWAVQAVKNLVAYRIVGGHNGYLRPTDNITRAEVAQLMYLVYLDRNK